MVRSVASAPGAELPERLSSLLAVVAIPPRMRVFVVVSLASEDLASLILTVENVFNKGFLTKLDVKGLDEAALMITF